MNERITDCNNIILLIISYLNSSSANVLGRGLLRVSGRVRLAVPVSNAKHPISSIGSPSLYCACRISRLV